jgi:tetratricopeptide (TPR) repeat protein
MRAPSIFENYIVYPKANDTRITCPAVACRRDYAKARHQFQQLLAENPNADIVVAVGLLSLELRDYDAAESNFKKALELDYRIPAWCVYLGGVYEKQQR